MINLFRIANKKNFIVSILFVFLLGLILCMTSGCSIFSSQSARKINYFDIGFPDSSNSVVLEKPVVVNNFVSSSPYYTRMVFRTSEKYQEVDDYNRWSSSPDQMLKRYFILALESKNIEKINKGNEYLELDATILSLEADIQEKTVTLILKIDITYGKNENIEYSELINIQEPLNAVSANQFAEALGIAVGKAVKKTTNALLYVGSMSSRSGVIIQ